MSIDLDILITGEDRLAAAVERVLAQSGDVLRAETHATGERYLKALKDATPRGRGVQKGKRLVDSYDVDAGSTATEAHYRIVNAASYLGYVLKGRGPVVAKRAWALRFVIDGQVYFRKRVGPAAANPFDTRVKAQMRGDVEGLPERIAGRVVRLYGGGA
jgi:hypothetical protein